MTSSLPRAPRPYAWGLASLAGLAVAAACGGATSSSGSNSNWLAVCANDTDCDGGLRCLCGQCTLACGEQHSRWCDDLGGTCAEATGDCSAVEQVPVCVAQCDADPDCDRVSPGLRCDAGRCVIPGDRGGTGGAPTTPSAPSFDQCTSEPYPAAATGVGPRGTLTSELASLSVVFFINQPQHYYLTVRGTSAGVPLGLYVQFEPEIYKSGTYTIATDGSTPVSLEAALNGDPSTRQAMRGALEISAAEPPTPGVAAVHFKGTLRLDDGPWQIEVPLDLPELCQAATIVK